MRIDIDKGAVRGVEHAVTAALAQTAEWVVSDVRKAQTVPRDKGVLQGEAMHVVASALEGVEIVQSTPYARRLYHHPEYGFSREANPNAGALWWEPYIDGGKRKDVERAFLRACRRNGLDVAL
jgi:hypothetical protein